MQMRFLDYSVKFNLFLLLYYYYVILRPNVYFKTDCQQYTA